MTSDRDSALAAVRAAHEGHDGKRHDNLVYAAVHAAYAAGATVAQIADVVGQHQPHVTRKYGPFEPRSTVISIPPERLERNITDALDVLRAAVDVPGTFAPLVEAVAAARQAGVTWQQIADVMDRSQPNVVAQFRPLLQVEQTTTVTVGDIPAQTRVHLSDGQRAELTRRVKAGESPAVLAAEFGASTAYVRGLRRKP